MNKFLMVLLLLATVVLMIDSRGYRVGRRRGGGKRGQKGSMGCQITENSGALIKLNQQRARCAAKGYTFPSVASCHATGYKDKFSKKAMKKCSKIESILRRCGLQCDGTNQITDVSTEAGAPYYVA